MILLQRRKEPRVVVVEGKIERVASECMYYENSITLTHTIFT